MNQSQATKDQVKKAYGEIARTRTEAAPACCAPATVPADYSPQEVASVPPGAYLAEGSGNPVRFARLQPGEMVVDLGSGAGMDVFLAANAVGASGRVIGVDMTPEMLARAEANAQTGRYPQVEFRQGDIENLPIPSETADVILSNCVINLAPDKTAVFREMYRVLRPGGRFAISDIVLRREQPFSQKMLKKLAAASPANCGASSALAGASCVASAWEERRYLDALRAAGFHDVNVVSERAAVDQPALDFIKARAVTLVGVKPA
jgi:SAM-dependent methyltransferase